MIVTEAVAGATSEVHAAATKNSARRADGHLQALALPVLAALDVVEQLGRDRGQTSFARDRFGAPAHPGPDEEGDLLEALLRVGLPLDVATHETKPSPAPSRAKPLPRPRASLPCRR